ncbi:MAG: phosphatase PAP2 family protein [Spirochaetes bacterium]|nr:phosphatase PAP2 family protein [Spirochaetota bacterium]
MEALLGNRVLFGEETLNRLHIFAGPWLDAAMAVVTVAGDEPFYLVALPVIYWCWDRRIAIYAGAAFLVTMTLNDWIKYAVNHPRPDPEKLLPGIRELALRHAPQSPGFPSGHTQGSLAFWTSVAILCRRPLFWVLWAVMIVLVPYSRLYLGVHYPGDVVGGLVIGALSLALIIPALALGGAHYRKFNEWVLIAVIITVPLLVCLSLAGEHIYATTGTLSGFLAGALMGETRIRFNPRARLPWQPVKAVIGIAVVAALRLGLKALLPETLLAGFMRYWLIGFWCSFGAPWLFSQFGPLRGEAERNAPGGSGT